METDIKAIFKMCSPDKFIDKKTGETISFISVLAENQNEAMAQRRLVNFSMLPATYDNMNANELNSLVGKMCLFSGRTIKRFEGGLKFIVEEIKALK
jgi:hypothetical protein